MCIRDRAGTVILQSYGKGTKVDAETKVDITAVSYTHLKRNE